MENEEIDQVIQHQKETEGEIQRIWINFKKDSTTRYSKQYFEMRLENLRQKWDAFEDNNDNLIKNLKPDHEYITKHYFGQLQQRRNEIENQFNNELKTLRQREQEEARSSRNQDISINDEVIITEPCDITNKRLAILSTSLLQIKETIDLTKSVETLQFKFEKLKNFWAKILQLHDECLLRNDAINHEDFIQLESIYEGVYIQLQEELNVRSQNVSDTRTSLSNNIKLPPLNVPIFNGRYEEWCPFWELFDRLLQQNHNLVDVKRMQYLKGSLRGEAARLINHLTITANNYTATVELLKQRYNNPAIRVDNLINKEVLYGIRNLNVDTSSWDPLIIQILLPKLDGATRKLYQHIREASTQIPKLNSLYEFIESRVRRLEATRDTNRENKNNFRPTAVNTKRHVTTIHTLCLVCNGNHQLIRCSKFLNMKVPERCEKIMSAKLCFNCLQSVHFIKLCLNKKICTICDKKHHHLTHEQVKGKPTFTNNINKQRMPTLKNATETEVAASYNIQKENIVLLATAMVIIRTKKQLNPIRALLDQGSQSCIIEQLARSISTPLTNYQTQVKGINEQTTSVIAKCSLEIQSIHDKNKSYYIEAIVLPKITSKIPNAEFTPGN
ncbi:uncharacterized protein LOC119665664 [Teleopsis dalmanni]|uniref:uncharacterized protein LOC119665664 n=1 Tax=Teleopsis dalmanni TaxID=139649 RepID=UPI0018CF65E8|nr:uncharacterized protein LOC119665664 [Teleopsis dalmanni]